jgi:hypothetical protein
LHGGGSDWGFHGGLVVVVATSVTVDVARETTFAAACIYARGNCGGDSGSYGDANNDL